MTETIDQLRRRVRILQLQAQARAQSDGAQPPATAADRIAAARAGTLQVAPERLAAVDGANQRAEMAMGVQPDLPEGMVMNPDTGQATSRELMGNARSPSFINALSVGGLQGQTFAGADEAAGIGGEYQRESMRANLDAARRDYPLTTLAGEVIGAASIPIGGAIKGASRLVQGAPALANAAGALAPLARAQTVGGAAVRGAAAGAVGGAAYGFGAGEGGFESRAGTAFDAAKAGALFGAASGAAISIGTKGFRRLFTKSQERPTVDNLRATKTAAYNAVENSGETFSPDDMKGIYDRAVAAIDTGSYVPEVDRQTFAALRQIENMQGREMTIGQLDKVRQSLWKRYAAAPNENSILDVIDSIDEAIAGRADTSELMAAARLAHSRYKKAELLDDAFKKARDQTASTGSGGNILNKYRQAVTAIRNNPKQAKWFTADELKVMDDFINSTATENILRRVGKLAPGGNGLMLALNLFGAGTFGAPALMVTGAAAAAKGVADRGAMEGAEGLLTRMATGASAARPAPVRIPAAIGPISGAVAAP